jgi:hypothetical protein
MGRNWYQYTGVALTLGRQTFFFILNGRHLGFAMFCRRLNPNYWQCGEELAKR